jgi:SIR2-like domain
LRGQGTSPGPIPSLVGLRCLPVNSKAYRWSGVATARIVRAHLMAEQGIGKEHRCDECGDDVEAPLPERLVEDTHAGKVVLFVGSGASTEAHNVIGHTFYDSIRSELGEKNAGIAFPDLMSAFVSRFSRGKLLTAFVDRLRYIDSHPFFHRRATRFHRAVGQIPYFQEIVTTNWDDYFETQTGAIPLVQGSDFDYWDLNQRKVLKVHGSVLNPGSVVATREEYEGSLEALRSGAVGAAAKHLMATHSVVFVGYSLRDDDIRQVIEALRHDLNSAARPTYFVHPNPAFKAPLAGAEVINTSAGFFVELLDRALVEAEYLLPLKLYDRAATMDQRLREARSRVDDNLFPWQLPLVIFNHAYQDGLGDAIDHTVAARRTGVDRQHHKLVQTATGYEKARQLATRARKYWDAAYIEGYGTGLLALGASSLPLHIVPLYYCPGVGQISSFKRLAAAVRGGPDTHRGAFAWAARQAKDLPVNMYPFHQPSLPE